MRYHYRCDECNITLEHVQDINLKLPESLVCPACSAAARYVIEGAPFVSRVGMSKASLDTIIGRDADKRWQHIREQQAIRDKIRRESGEVGITLAGSEYKPISPENKALRTKVQKVLSKEGHKPQYDASDSKIMNKP